MHFSFSVNITETLFVKNILTWKIVVSQRFWQNGGQAWIHQKKNHILPWQNRLFYEVNDLPLLVYKEAFMKAHPDFKWYKIPPLPSRTLVTRPSNRANLIGNFKKNHNLGNCGINLGKLLDDEQLGSLSSLINTTASKAITSENLSIHNSSMAQKSTESILKPPKKRYIINGEFQSNSDMLSIDYQDSQTRNACSALLELAKVCPNSSVLENSSLASAPVKMSNCSSKPATVANGSPYTNLTNSLDVSKTEFTTVSSGKQEGLQNLPFMSLKINNDGSHHSESTSQQEQPLDLCKNKEKSEVADGEKTKTITTSHQRLIDHFVDKFLCDSSVPHSKFYKSQIIDPAFCKLFSERSLGTSSDEGKISHSAFTLSVAIESAVDKAYSKDYSKSSPIPESNLLLDCIDSETQEYNVKFKSEVENEKLKSSSMNNTRKEYLKESSSADKVSSHLNSGNQASKKDSTDTPGTSSSKYYCKLISPPKKSSVWCNLFMNEQQTKNSIESNSNHVSNTGSDFSSPARRSSQRTCKGRRYQALITEGLLQSPKERKQSNSKKAVSPLSKVKNKINSLSENHMFNSPKRKKKKDSIDKKKHSPESLGLCTRNFDMEKQITSLPKCNLEILKKNE